MITIHKHTASRNGIVRVTFSVPTIEGCEFLYLVGWFDEWDESVFQMHPTPAGGWSLTLELGLEPGCEYHYRFRTSDGRWLNDLLVPPALPNSDPTDCPSSVATAWLAPPLAAPFSSMRS